MAAGVPMAAKFDQVRIGVTAYYAQEWEVTDETNFDDTTNFEGSGFGEQVACIKRARIRINGWWDAGANPFDNPPNIKSGNRLATVKLYLGGVNSSVFWSFPFVDVVSSVHGGRVDQKINLTLELMSFGPFTAPTGNAA